MKLEIFSFPALAVIVLLAGCGYIPQGEEVHLGYRGSLNASASGFQMEGNLSASGGIPDKPVYRDVTVGLYSAEGDLLHTEHLGDMRTDRKLALSLSIDSIPQYVIFDSPDFWREPMQEEYYVRMDSNYGVEYATERDEFPQEIAP